MPYERCMVCNWLTMYWIMGICSCLLLAGMDVVSSFCRSCITLPMLGTWVLRKLLKLCNRGSGGLTWNIMSRHLFGVVSFAN